VVILPLGFAWTKEADHALRIKSVGGSTQATFSQTGFLRPFCWGHPKQGDRANPFIQALFWRPTPLEEPMIVIGSLSAFSLGFWHLRAPGYRQRRADQGSFFA